MPVEWTEYDGFDWAASQQSPMPDGQRAAVADLAADVLGLSPADREPIWGRASPPGRFAATVVRVSPDVEHKYREAAAAAGVVGVGVKVFKPTADARREADRVLPLHRTGMSRLPGLPNERVQRSLDAGTRRARSGEDRAFVVQEWVDGPTLEELLRPECPIGGAVARSVLDQLLGGIVIPLWAAGTVWWDIRDANACYNPATDRLSLIDADSLAAYADEILRTPQVWEKRDKGRTTALSRLKQTAVRVVAAQGGRGKAKTAAAVGAAWAAELEPAFLRLGKDPTAAADAAAALGRFLDRLEAGGLFAGS